jgi:uncharacterized protein with NRDE domain
VILGANREEFYGRGGEPPQLLPGRLRAVGGRDPMAKGTWLGVNERGVLAAVTNRPKSRIPEQPRSRGLLTRDLLDCPNARDAAELAERELSRNAYAGCNLLCVDADQAYVLHAGDRLEVRTLTPGLHALTAQDVDDPRDPRLAYALAWLRERRLETVDAWVAALKELCGQRGTKAPPMCLRGERGGTISSSILALRWPLGRSLYWHAQGPPDVTPYQDYAQLLRELDPNPSPGD